MFFSIFWVLQVTNRMGSGGIDYAADLIRGESRQTS